MPATTFQPQLVAYIQDAVIANAASPSTTAGSWQTRFLTILNDVDNIGISLASNQFTLPAGTYDIDFQSTFYFSGNSIMRLRNITDSITTLVSEFSYQGSGVVGAPVKASGRVVLTAPKVFQLQYFCDTGAGIGYGGQISAGAAETYPTSLVKITKIR